MQTRPKHREPSADEWKAPKAQNRTREREQRKQLSMARLLDCSSEWSVSPSERMQIDCDVPIGQRSLAPVDYRLPVFLLFPLLFFCAFGCNSSAMYGGTTTSMRRTLSGSASSHGASSCAPDCFSPVHIRLHQRFTACHIAYNQPL